MWKRAHTEANYFRYPMVYVALLRGINVGGKNIVEMARLKQAFEELGFTSVKTYIIPEMSSSGQRGWWMRARSRRESYAILA
jgi:hypothetical protein